MKVETAEDKAKVNEAQRREQRARQTAGEKGEQSKLEGGDSAEGSSSKAGG